MIHIDVPSKNVPSCITALSMSSLFLVLILCEEVCAQVVVSSDLVGRAAEYQKILDEDPTSVEAHLNLGLAYLSLGAVDRAAETFEKARRLDENYAAGYYCLGGTYLLQKQYEKASEVLEAAVRRFPDWGQAHAQLGVTYFRRQSYVAADAAFKKGIALMEATRAQDARLASSPILQEGSQTYTLTPLSQAGVSYFLGRTAFERDLVDSAIAYYEQAIRLGPPLAEAHFWLGIALLRKQQEEKAEKAFRNAIRVNPELASTHYRLALLYFRQDKKTQAKRAMEKFRRLKAELADEVDMLRAPQGRGKSVALSNLGWKYIKDKKYEAAIQQFKKSLWHDPKNAAAYSGLSHIYAMQERFEEALESQQHGVQLKPHMASSHSELGFVWFRKAQSSGNSADFEKALSSYRRAVELEADNPEDWLNIGSIAFELSRLQEAQAAYEKPLSLLPDDSRAHLGLARVYLGQDKPQQAANHYQEAIKRNPNLPEAYHMLGLIALWKGRLDEAADNLNAAVSLQPEMAETHYFLGTIYAKLNETERAVQAFQQSISLNPSFDKAYERLAQLYAALNTRLDEALELAKKAVEIQPNSAIYLNTLSWLYYRNRDYVSAEEAIQKALILQPDNPKLLKGLETIQAARQRRIQTEGK